jgi:DNA helicase II / ATP-dependent DNA helicase PcrA
MMHFLNELNENQRRAAEHTEGPLLVLAGAGAGKTKTVTYRILNLIHQGVRPEEILAVTFTNKAAKEMRERVVALLEKDKSLNLPISNFSRPMVATFHSLCVYIIKENAEAAGLTRHFSIYDRSDSKKIIKDALEKKGYNPKEFEPNKIISIISREKGNFLTANEYEAGASQDFFGKVIAEVWQEYDIALRKENALDFDDLLLVAATMLKKEEIRKKYSEHWKYVHIDEYQDTNKVQYAIVEAIARDHKNVCAVGDVDQNIYSWRGASIRNILNFEKDYPGSRMILLEENYRSTQTILAVANRVIQKNKMRMEKNLFTNNSIGERLGIFEGVDENHEAQFIALKAKELVKQGAKYSDIAVLYRANFQSRVLEEECLAKDIPYQVLGTKFFDRKEVKDTLSYLRLSLNPECIADLKRIINVPARGIGKTTLLKIVEGKETELPAKMRLKIAAFRETLEKIKEFALANNPGKTIMFIAEETGLLSELKDEEGGEERQENVKELAGLAERYENVEKLLEEVSLMSDQDSDKEEVDAVRLMTIHASKGLEFPYVFIVGLEDGLFPHNHDNQDLSQDEEEEERRLFYVAITRAKKKLFLSYAETRSIYGSRGINTPSEFLLEVPDHYTEKEFLDYTPRRRPLLHIEF